MSIRVQDIDCQCADDILSSRNFDEVKAATANFIAKTEILESMFVWQLCRYLADALIEWAKPYSAAPRGAKNNVVIVPPEHAPVMLLLSSIPINGSPNQIIDGLKKFIVRCDEFTSPLLEAVTVAEMNRVLNAAQKSYGILDLLAPKEPQKIYRFNNSHIKYNSMCGIPGNSENAATILVYHPRESGIYDRVFIFAHELGHALHFALTKNIEVMPDGFEAFNQTLGVKLENLKEQQEAFADSVALAILNVKGLRTHFPSEWGKAMSYSHAKYLRGLCTGALQKSGLLSEPLPMPYSPFDKMLREIYTFRANGINATDCAEKN